MVVVILISSVAYHRAGATSNVHTYLLFNFITNQSGFDTGIVISNTSMDPFGSKQETGTCTLYFYGTGPPASTHISGASIPPGTQWTELASEIAAGFQGYMIADCSFHYAHGTAFIMDGYGQP